MSSVCLYEILELERDATGADIKKAYKRLALRWHPDKNPDKKDEADKMFKEIQRANSILSDPQERAWYDQHREQILAGGDGTTGESEGVEVGINLFSFFSASCFNSFDLDDPKSFYNVYGAVFMRLDEEEKLDRNLDRPHIPTPQFGSRHSPWSETAEFYSFWGDFVSQRTFAGADKYHIPSAPNRQVKRLMEKENRKERDQAKRERQETVRHLVQWIKKRDPRVAEHEKDVRKRKQEREREAAEERARAREEHAAKKRVWQEQRARELEREEAAMERGEIERADAWLDEEDSDKAKDEKVFLCMACNKSFKSAKQFANHEKSKKHRQRVEELRQEILEEEGLLEESDSDVGLLEDSESDAGSEGHQSVTDADVADRFAELDVEGASVRPEGGMRPEGGVEGEGPSAADLGDGTDEAPKHTGGASEVEEPEVESPELSVDEILQRLIAGDLEDRGTATPSRAASKSKKKKKAKAARAEATVSPDTAGVIGGEDGESQEEASQGQQKGKSRRRKNKNGSQTDVLCNTCGTEFPSRTRLFKHLEETGHALRK